MPCKSRSTSSTRPSPAAAYRGLADRSDVIASEVGYKVVSEAQLDEEGNEIFPATTSYTTEPTSGPGAIDIIGTIFNDDAVYSETETDSEGFPALVSPATPIDGYHVNICLRADSPLLEQFGQYILDPAPATPSRTFG